VSVCLASKRGGRTSAIVTGNSVEGQKSKMIQAEPRGGRAGVFFLIACQAAHERSSRTLRLQRVSMGRSSATSSSYRLIIPKQLCSDGCDPAMCSVDNGCYAVATGRLSAAIFDLTKWGRSRTYSIRARFAARSIHCQEMGAPGARSAGDSWPPRKTLVRTGGRHTGALLVARIALHLITVRRPQARSHGRPAPASLCGTFGHRRR